MDRNARPVLIIDDNDEDYEMLTIAFESCNIDRAVARFDSAVKSVKYFEKFVGIEEQLSELPALVLLDLNLTDAEGVSVLRFIKTNANLKSIPVVIFSTSANPKDVEVCYENGANGFVVKPVDVDRLYQFVSSVRDYWLNFNVLPGERYGRK